MNFLTQLFDASLRFQRLYAAHLLNRFRWMNFPSARIALATQWVEPRGLWLALASSPRLVITGASGMGKTTTLAYLASKYANAMQSQPKPRIPLYFSVADLNAATLPRITDLPRDLELSQEVAAQCPRVFFPDAFNSGRAIVMIDDADLLSAEQFAAWLREFKDAQIIITASAPFDGFAEFALPGFRDNDIEKFATQWNAANAGAFMASLKSSGVPRALTSNPTMLTLLTQVWRADQPLPARRTDLFDAFVQSALDDSDETVKMLEGVALAVQRGRPASNEFLAKSRGFMRAGKNRTAEFVHPLWQAYFAARALHLAPSLTSLHDYLTDPAWREVVLFLAGLGDASELVDVYLVQANVAMAGRVVAHARQLRDGLRETVTKELINHTWEGDTRAATVLSEMQSDVAVDAFAAKLKDKDPQIRTRSAEILGQLQLDRGIEYLLPQLRDVNADVRDRVIQALGRSRTDRVVEPLLVALRGDSRVGIVDTRLRIAAAHALGEIASDKAFPALMVDMQIGEPEVRAVAAESLKRITSPLMLKPLQNLTQSSDELTRQYAADIWKIVNGKNSI